MNHMAIELQRLIEKASHLDITLIAGREGLHNLVSWVHMIESIEAASFLNGGEIAILTGLGVSEEEHLLDLVRNIWKKKAAGIIINTGPFLESVPETVIDFCNAHDFPLFTVPWKIHLSEIMRIFCFSLTREEQRTLETAAAFKNAIFFPTQEELYLVPLSQRNFNSEWKYAVCAMKLDVAQGDPASRIDTLTMSLENYARHKYGNFAIFTYNSEIIIVAADYTEEQLTDFINDLLIHARIFMLQGESLSLGVGRLTKSIRCLYKSYQQALSIQKLQKNKKIDPQMIFYSQMGLYQLLLGIEDRNIIQDYYERTIGALLEYDAANDSDLASVLKSYLNHNGSVKETSDELFVHRNTVNYKLNKIEELLHVDLSALNVRLQLMIAFMLQDML